MSINDFAALTGAIATVIGGVVVGIKWTIKHYLSELKPNGGSSLKDKVNQLAQGQVQQGEEIQRLGGRIDAIYQFLLERGQ